VRTLFISRVCRSQEPSTSRYDFLYISFPSALAWRCWTPTCGPGYRLRSRRRRHCFRSRRFVSCWRHAVAPAWWRHQPPRPPPPGSRPPTARRRAGLAAPPVSAPRPPSRAAHAPGSRPCWRRAPAPGRRHGNAGARLSPGRSRAGGTTGGRLPSIVGWKRLPTWCWFPDGRHPATIASQWLPLVSENFHTRLSYSAINHAL